LNYLSHEAYWYFFKTLSFGSMDPVSHKRLLCLAIEISRDSFDIHFWCKVLSFYRCFIKKSICKFGEHPFVLVNQNKPIQIGRMATPSQAFMVYREYQCTSQEEVPKIKMDDVMVGNVRPHGKFEALGWSSQLPPYYNCVYTCEILEMKTTPAKRKRSVKN
ncbi:hypothetical protein BAE44_0025603, partial [Dichanthelium oligosanthes]